MAGMQIHMIKRHTGGIIHVCTYCQRGFGQLNEFSYHMKFHIGDNPPKGKAKKVIRYKKRD